VPCSSDAEEPGEQYREIKHFRIWRDRFYSSCYDLFNTFQIIIFNWKLNAFDHICKSTDDFVRKATGTNTFLDLKVFQILISK